MNFSLWVLITLSLLNVTFVYAVPIVSAHPIIIIATPKSNHTLKPSPSNKNTSSSHTHQSCTPHLNLSKNPHLNQTHALLSNSTWSKHHPCSLSHHNASAPFGKNVTLPSNNSTSQDLTDWKPPTNTTKAIDNDDAQDSETTPNTQEQNGANSNQLKDVDVFSLRPHHGVAQLLENDRGDDESDHNDGGDALLWAPAGFLIVSSMTIVSVVVWRKRRERK
ncbi:hypothetical protein DM02DRAFT_613897 [Periconia macrospinosa]|uniref:Uncharacterized protein n=1 Tax=Periconia macrospinosa TaxID=97972 RepID=A0A2V1DTC7_9PLEO|nr:hypothetical protein DM02DRAFT_613897 [Periconia macrospinosa]